MKWVESVVEPLLKEFARRQDILMRDAFRDHFGFDIEEVQDKENIEHVSIVEDPIHEFKYRGETFMYIRHDPEYEVVGDKVTMGIKYLKV